MVQGGRAKKYSLSNLIGLPSIPYHFGCVCGFQPKPLTFVWTRAFLFWVARTSAVNNSWRLGLVKRKKPRLKHTNQRAVFGLWSGGGFVGCSLIKPVGPIFDCCCGKSFSEIFKSVSYDFYNIDPMLFAPAKVIVSNLNSGKSWIGGKLNLSLLEYF